MSMADLVVHIGFPKTGTSTIQRFLADSACFLGKSNAFRQRSLGKRLEHIARDHNLLDSWEYAARRWARDVASWRAAKGLGCETLVVSAEGLSDSGERGLRGRSIIEKVGVLRDQVWQEGNVKVVLVLRNQADWLASRYIQRARRCLEASQDDFEKRTRAVLQDSDRHLDWSLWVDELRDKVGTSNVGVFLLEDMSATHFWSDLAHFLGLEAGAGPESGNDDRVAQKGVRSREGRVWHVPEHRRGPANVFIEDDLGIKKVPGARHVTRLITRQVSRHALDLDAQARKVVPYRRDALIEMSWELREEIRHHCAPFNRRLAKQLDRGDLTSLGY